jgi:hypothetical protein
LFPFLGPGIIDWLLDLCARSEGLTGREASGSIPIRLSVAGATGEQTASGKLICGSMANDETIGTDRGKPNNNTNQMEESYE